MIFVKIIAPLFILIWGKQMVKSAKGRSAPATRVGRRAQTDVEESMADCIAEVDDVAAGLDAALPAEPATGPIPDNLLRLR